MSEYELTPEDVQDLRNLRTDPEPESLDCPLCDDLRRQLDELKAHVREAAKEHATPEELEHLEALAGAQCLTCSLLANLSGLRRQLAEALGVPEGCRIDFAQTHCVACGRRLVWQHPERMATLMCPSCVMDRAREAERALAARLKSEEPSDRYVRRLVERLQAAEKERDEAHERARVDRDAAFEAFGWLSTSALQAEQSIADGSTNDALGRIEAIQAEAARMARRITGTAVDGEKGAEGERTTDA